MPEALLQSLDSEGKTLHVFDLPQLSSKPSAVQILEALALLSLQPPCWDKENLHREHPVAGSGVTQYLTSIIASGLGWITDDDATEEIYNQASLRLSERSGRFAMPAMTRVFHVSADTTGLDIVIHEPSLTEDKLGLKTWAASFLMAKRLNRFAIPRTNSLHGSETHLSVLELGSGTGLVGIAAAAVWGASVFLTDLPEITDNLYRNATENLEVSQSNGGKTTTAVLDWTNPKVITPINSVSSVPVEFPVIVAADSIYSPEHPALLVKAIETWLSTDLDARVILELPIRAAYSSEHRDLRLRLSCVGLTCIDQGNETGLDDWGYSGHDPELPEVECWWSVWGWRHDRMNDKASLYGTGPSNEITATADGVQTDNLEV